MNGPRLGAATTALTGVAALLMLPGCGDVFGNKDPHQPGTALGMFHASASLTHTSCGSGALGSPSSWEFDVKLSRGEGVIYWYNGTEVIPGTLAADAATFAFDTGIVMNMRTEQDLGLPPCSIARHDHAEGILKAGQDASSVESFSATLSYQFAPTQDSECTDLVLGESPVFAALPCAVLYELTAARTDPPLE